MNNHEWREHAEKSINFLVFWGKLDMFSALRMPTYKRQKWIEWTHKNLETLFGKKK